MATKPGARGRGRWAAAVVACVAIAAGCSSAGAHGARTPPPRRGAIVAPGPAGTTATSAAPPSSAPLDGSVNAPAVVLPTVPPAAAPAPGGIPAAGALSAGTLSSGTGPAGTPAASPAGGPPTATGPSPTAAPPNTTAPPPACRADGTGCAPNQAMTVRATLSPAHPVAGDTVTFSVTASDPDAPIDPGGCGRHHAFGDERSGTTCAPSCTAPDPSTTFQPSPGRVDETFTHVYAAAGTYTALFDFHSGGECSGDPYASSGEARISVIVS